MPRIIVRGTAPLPVHRMELHRQPTAALGEYSRPSARKAHRTYRFVNYKRFCCAYPPLTPKTAHSDRHCLLLPPPRIMGPSGTSHHLSKHDQHGTGWALQEELASLKERDDQSGFPPRELGVTWKGLTVEATSPDAAIHENVLSQFNLPKILQQSRRKPPMKTILENSFGCVQPGEMLLVLGRPGQYIGWHTASFTALFASLTHVRCRIRMHDAP